MKKYLLTLLLLVLTTILGLHTWQKVPVIIKTGYGAKDYKAIVKAEKRKRRASGHSKFDGPNEYMKYHHAIRAGKGKNASTYQSNYRLQALQKARRELSQYRAQHRMGNQTVEWKERGPANVGGRTRGLIVSAADPTQKTWYAGSVGGGVWKTTDEGSAWTNLTPDLPNLATTTLAQCKQYPQVIYAGTGEGFFNSDAINGDGIFKTEDGGSTWFQLDATSKNPLFQNVNRIIVSPENPDLLLACSNTSNYWDAGISAIMRSEDGGSSWQEVYRTESRIQQLLVDPSDFNTQYASINRQGVLKSIDGGINWNLVSKGLMSNGRIEIAISPVDNAVLYASCEGGQSGNFSDLFVSFNAGENWQLVKEKGQEDINWLGSQGWYDNTIMAHPFEVNSVYVGGVQLWKMDVSNSNSLTWQLQEAFAENTESFMAFVNLGGSYLGGGMLTGEQWFATEDGYPQDLELSDNRNVEIRFGEGITQQAHRFTVPEGATSGVPPSEFRYRDYVEVPFQVWDAEANTQLMVSFRDQDADGKFNLIPAPNDENQEIGREYIYIHGHVYGDDADASIGQSGGIGYKTLYALWTVLQEEANWEPDNLPEARIVINGLQVEARVKKTRHISDAYQQLDGLNQYVHPDHHNLLPIITNQETKEFKILNANDGGVLFTKAATNPGENEGDWLLTDNGYNTSQFYGVDKKPGEEQYIGGMQDNGTWYSAAEKEAAANTDYRFAIGGDGFQAVWHAAEPVKMIGGAQFNAFYRSGDGGESWYDAAIGIDKGEASAPFISKLENAKNNPDVLYAAGRSGVWKSENFGESWSLGTVTSQWQGNASFVNIKISGANNDIVWAGSGMEEANRIHVSGNGGQSFNAVNNSSVVAGPISGMATHPTEDSTAFLLYSFAGYPKVLRTTDLGENWQDISGFSTEGEASTNGFPDVAVYSLLVMPHDPDIIWVGTEIGLVESTDNGRNWHLADNGLPATAIWDMKVADDQIVAATHGRGIWTASLPELPELVFVPFIKSLSSTYGGGLQFTALFREAFDSTLVYVDKELVAKMEANQAGEFNAKLEGNYEGELSLQLKSFREGLEYPSPSRFVNVIPVTEIYKTYSNNFEDNRDDFEGDDFSEGAVPGFIGKFLHTAHPYPQNKNLIYRLRNPVVIAAENSFFEYHDVAIVEPGEVDSKFDQAEFYDYVVVEGSKDGLNWEQISGGYDASFDEGWQSLYNDKASPNASNLHRHRIDLHETFAPDDTVYFRFRLFSDPFETGWGWIIDNIDIQKEGTALTTGFVEDVMASKLGLRVYPNPVVNGRTQLEYYLPEPGPVNLSITDIQGKRVYQEQLGHQGTGRHLSLLEGINYPAGIYMLKIETPFSEKNLKIIIR